MFEEFSAGDVDWTPRPLARAVNHRRTYRWGFVMIALLVGAGVGVGVVAGSLAPARAASARLEAFALRSDALSSALRAIDGELASAADPSAATVTRVVSVAADLKEIAALPDPWPVVVDTGYDLDRVHTAAFEASAAATAVAARATVLISYLSEAPIVIELPDLPGVRDGPALAELDAVLTVALAGAGARAVALPESTMAGHRAELLATIAALGEWRDTYLEALRTGDPDAGALGAAATARVAELDDLFEAERLRSLEALRDQVGEALRRVDEVRLLSS